jgi:hypothetical protein
MACCVMVSLVDSAGYHDHKHEPICAIWLSQTPWNSLTVTEYNLARFHNMCKRAAELVTAALIHSSADLYHMDNHTRMMSIPLSRIGHISRTALHRSDCARSDRIDLPYSTLSRRIHTTQDMHQPGLLTSLCNEISIRPNTAVDDQLHMMVEASVSNR